MIHSLKLKGNILEIDTYEIAKYPVLNNIYTRDISTTKSNAKKELHYIHIIADKSGYCTRNGLSDADAHLHAISASGLSSKYIPDDEVVDAIEFVKSNLNLDTVESLLISTIRGLGLTSKVMARLISRLEDIVSNDESSLADVIESEKIMKQFIDIASGIPSKIESFKTLSKEWDKQSESSNSIRGGSQYSDSYDGDPTIGNKRNSKASYID